MKNEQYFASLYLWIKDDTLRIYDMYTVYILLLWRARGSLYSEIMTGHSQAGNQGCLLCNFKAPQTSIIHVAFPPTIFFHQGANLDGTRRRWQRKRWNCGCSKSVDDSESSGKWRPRARWVVSASPSQLWGSGFESHAVLLQVCSICYPSIFFHLPGVGSWGVTALHQQPRGWGVWSLCSLQHTLWGPFLKTANICKNNYRALDKVNTQWDRLKNECIPLCSACFEIVFRHISPIINILTHSPESTQINDLSYAFLYWNVVV